MRGLFEFTGFAGLALALHVAAFQSLPQGSESAGSGGDALVTVAAVSGSLAALVDTWDRPPEVAAAVPAAMPQPEAEQVFSPMPPQGRTLAPQVVGQRPVAPVLPDRDAALSPDVAASVAPPVVPETKAPSKVRPQARPPEVGPATSDVRAEPAAKPKAKDAPRASQTAAGSDAAAARGTSGPAETASLTKAARQSLVADWGGKIRSRIERAKPRGAGRGTVTLVLTVRRDGALQSVAVATSSGQAALDGLAVKAVKSAGRLPAAPTGLTEASYTFRLPIRFN